MCVCVCEAGLDPQLLIASRTSEICCSSRGLSAPDSPIINCPGSRVSVFLKTSPSVHFALSDKLFLHDFCCFFNKTVRFIVKFTRVKVKVSFNIPFTSHLRA
jgi:hypothetical protein